MSRTRTRAMLAAALATAAVGAVAASCTMLITSLATAGITRGGSAAEKGRYLGAASTAA